MSEVVERMAAAIWTDEIAKNLGWEEPFSELPPSQQAILRRAASAAFDVVKAERDEELERWKRAYLDMSSVAKIALEARK